MEKELKNAVDSPWDSDIDSDHPTCNICGCRMDFRDHDENGDFDYGKGYWICNSCGFKITENDL